MQRITNSEQLAKSIDIWNRHRTGSDPDQWHTPHVERDSGGTRRFCGVPVGMDPLPRLSDHGKNRGRILSNRVPRIVRNQSGMLDRGRVRGAQPEKAGNSHLVGIKRKLLRLRFLRPKLPALVHPDPLVRVLADGSLREVENFLRKSMIRF